jgi:hypothetical protein
MDNFNVILQYSHFLLTQNGISLGHTIVFNYGLTWASFAKRVAQHKQSSVWHGGCFVTLHGMQLTINVQRH